MDKINAPRHSEKGSIFVYILLGVILFGTLAYVMARGMRGQSTDSMTDRQVELAASDIYAFAQKVAIRVDKVRAKSCSENDISFENPDITGYAHSPVAPDQCKIFEGAYSPNYSAPLLKWLDGGQSAQTGYGEWLFTSSTQSYNAGGNDDIIMILPYLKKNICIELNERLNVTNPSGNPPKNSGSAYDISDKYTGSITGGDAIQDGGTDLQDKQAGCFEGGGSPAAGTYHFFYVLLER